MLLTQLTTLKNRLGIADTTDDTLLTNLIHFASGRFERECNRSLERAVGVTEEFPAEASEIPLARFPVEAVTQFAVKSRESDGWEVINAVDYLVRRACVISLIAPLGVASQQARVTYTGGYVLPGTTPGAGQTALPLELEQACVEQCAYWYQNRHRLGLRSLPADGRTFFQLEQIDLLPQVDAILRSYERWTN